MNSNIKTGIFWVILACVLVLLWNVVKAAKDRPDKAISFTEFVADVDAGKIKKVSADQKELTVTDQDGKDLEFVLEDDAKIRLNDKDAKLKELKKGDEITVTYEKKGRKLIASKVECKRD